MWNVLWFVTSASLRPQPLLGSCRGKWRTAAQGRSLKSDIRCATLLRFLVSKIHVVIWEGTWFSHVPVRNMHRHFDTSARPISALLWQTLRWKESVSAFES